MEGLGGRHQVAVEGVELVPQCLRVGRESQARHLPHLARQGHMVGVLRDRDRNGEIHGVAAAGDELRGAERRIDARPAPAGVLLAPVADDAKGALDDIDLLGLLVLAGHLAEPAPALRAGPIGLVECVDDLDMGQRALRARAVARARWPLAVARMAPGAAALLRGRPEELAGARRELLLDGRQLELERGDRVLAPGARQLVGERGESGVEPVELGPLQEGHLPQALNVGFGLDPDHAPPL